MSCCAVGKHKQRSDIEARIASCDDDQLVADAFRGLTRAAVKKHRAHMAEAAVEPEAPVPTSGRVVQLRPRLGPAPALHEAQEKPAAEQPPSRGITDDEIENAYRRCVKLLDGLESLREKLENDELASARDILGAYKELRESITLLARLTRELGPEREVVIVQSARWKRVEAEIADALRPFPDAAKAVGKALQALDEVA